jgi:CRP/FNR family transcriptional regulator, cyclic AMP receptor protein
MTLLNLPADKEISQIEETALFKTISSEKISKILAICNKVRFREGDTIMREGDEGDSIYIILEGTVEVAKNLILKDGDEGEENRSNKVFTKLKADDHPVFGEIALLENAKRTATIKALTDCLFYEIRNSALRALVEEDHELGFRIMYNLATIVSSRLRLADEEVVKLTTVLSIILKES